MHPMVLFLCRTLTDRNEVNLKQSQSNIVVENMMSEFRCLCLDPCSAVRSRIICATFSVSVSSSRKQGSSSEILID
jgi:hypothetical protein